MDCPTIPELSYSAFGQRLSQRIKGERIPITGSFELTHRCNLRCAHCYLDEQHDGTPGMEELNLDEIRSILDQVAEAGCLWLLITGGEPLVRDDFEAIYTYAIQKGFLVSLFTNGTLITPRIADLLAAYKPFKVEITLYGYTQETYEGVTGIPGSHARCMRGIELLMARDIRLKLKTVLMTLNQHELGAMEAFAERLGANFRFDPMINAGAGGDRTPLAYRLSPEEIVQFDLSHPQRMEAWHTFAEHFVPTHTPQRSPYLYTCGAGTNTFHIDPYGKLSVCIVSREPEYDLRQGSFYEGWHNEVQKVRLRQASQNYACGDCRLLAMCGQCPAWGGLEHNDQEAPVEFLCKVAHLRADALGLELQPSTCHFSGGHYNGKQQKRVSEAQD